MQLKNKTVVITGGAGGIGSALAAACAEAGSNVVVSDLDAQAVAHVAKNIGGKSMGCNVRDESQIKQLIAFAEQTFGQVDIYISNAGLADTQPSHAASAADDTWQRQWDVHVMSHVWAARDLLPKMIARGDGYLVNIASAAGLLNQIQDAAYTATKHAAVAFAESLTIDHHHQGVKVSVVCPQYVNTDIIGKAKVEEDKPLPDGVLTPVQCAQSIVEGLQKEAFLILPHPVVGQYAAFKGTDRQRWVEGMQKLKTSLTSDDGKIDMSRLVNKV